MGKCLHARRLTALSGEKIPLRAGELELLKLFVENPNHREMEAFDRAIDIRILRNRRKVEVDPSRPTSIRTVRSAGYMFVPPDD
ncbi:Transcriptional regulatory protein, C terminal [Rhodospirillales bacterium URHD0017]|nr:Transcriptional regulatory protein, C terminal [Rhodospirillales bacterium URHD0017]